MIEYISLNLDLVQVYQSRSQPNVRYTIPKLYTISTKYGPKSHTILSRILSQAIYYPKSYSVHLFVTAFRHSYLQLSTVFIFDLLASWVITHTISL